jgi:hypothetical protein
MNNHHSKHQGDQVHLVVGEQEERLEVEHTVAVEKDSIVVSYNRHKVLLSRKSKRRKIRKLDA